MRQARGHAFQYVHAIGMQFLHSRFGVLALGYVQYEGDAVEARFIEHDAGDENR